MAERPPLTKPEIVDALATALVPKAAVVLHELISVQGHPMTNGAFAGEPLAIALARKNDGGVEGIITEGPQRRGRTLE